MKQVSICPINSNGCRYKGVVKIEICMFWRKRKPGCEIEALISSLRAIPNLLRRIEKQLEEGKQLE